jgi:hypothetical protein
MNTGETAADVIAIRIHEMPQHVVMELTAAMLTRRNAAARVTEEHRDSPSSHAVTGANRISVS